MRSNRLGAGGSTTFFFLGFFGSSTVAGAAASGAAAVAASVAAGAAAAASVAAGVGRNLRRGAALQGGEFGIAHFEQAARLGEFALELLYTRLEVGAAGRSRCGSCRRGLGGRGGGSRRRSGALLRCHQTQPSCIGRCSRRSAGAAAPGVVLARDFGRRFSGRNRADLAGIRDAQGAARTQQIDVAVECLRIVLIDRNHRAVDVRARARVRGTGDFPERVVALHAIGAAGLDAGRGLADHALGANGFVRGIGHGCRGPGGGRTTRTDAGCSSDGFSGSGTRGIHRGIEQDRVFAQQAAARPVGFDQQGDEGLGHRPGRRDAQYVAAAGALGHLETEVHQEGGAIEPVANEGIVGSQRGTQGAEVFLGGRDEFDLGVKRLVERRVQLDFTQTERVQGTRGEQRAHEQDAAYSNLHRVSHRSRIMFRSRQGATAPSGSRIDNELNITIAHGRTRTQLDRGCRRLCSPLGA